MKSQNLHSLFFSLILGMQLFAQSHNNSKLSKDSIASMLDSVQVLFETQTNANFHKATNLLDKGLLIAQKKDDSELLAIANALKAYFFTIANNDTLTDKHINKALEYSRSVSNPKCLGDLYSVFGAIKSRKQEKSQALEAFHKAKTHYKLSNSETDLIDVYYNLGIEYNVSKQYEKSILYAKKALELIRKLGIKKDKTPYLHLYIAENNLHLGQPYDAKKHIDLVEKDSSIFNKEDLKLQSIISKTKANYFTAIGDYTSAYLFWKKAYDNLSLLGSLKLQNHGKTLVLKEQYAKEVEDEKRMFIENKLYKAQLKNSKYVFVLGTFLILALSVLAYISWKNVKKQTRLSNLLKKRYKEVVKLSKTANKALKVKSEFIDSITHELKTPLNTIKSVIYLMKTNEQSKENSEKIELLDASSDHLLNLINDVVDIKMLKENKRNFKKDTIHLRNLINKTIDALLSSSNTKNVLIHRDIDDAIPELLEGDTLSLTQILNNLIQNAIKFTKEGEITVKVKLKSFINNSVIIDFAISDTGIGIPKQHQDNIFERSRQGSENIQKEYGGSGIGLSIVKELVEAQGSKITVDSEEGKGATFSFELEYKSLEKQKKSSKILIVEDNMINQLLVKEILSKNGYTCDTAMDGIEAVEMAKKNHYALILMDIMMPRMDGFEATKEIRGFNSETPVFALTALSAKENREKFNQAGIEVVLNKPISPNILLQKIKTAIGKENIEG